MRKKSNAGVAGIISLSLVFCAPLPAQAELPPIQVQTESASPTTDPFTTIPNSPPVTKQTTSTTTDFLMPTDPLSAVETPCTTAMCGVTAGQTVSGTVFVQPNLSLNPDIRKVAYYLNGTQAGKYYSPPFTWGGAAGYDTTHLQDGNYTLGGAYTTVTGDKNFSIAFIIKNSVQPPTPPPVVSGVKVDQIDGDFNKTGFQVYEASQYHTVTYSVAGSNLDGATFQWSWSYRRNGEPEAVISQGSGTPAKAVLDFGGRPGAYEIIFRGSDGLTSVKTVQATEVLPGTWAMSNTPTLFLDFDGSFVANWGGYSDIATPAYDQDGDKTSFTEPELTNIGDIVKTVVEKFSIFGLFVTALDPFMRLWTGAAYATPADEFNARDAFYTQHKVLVDAIGGDGLWTGLTDIGGVSYVDSFTNDIPNYGFVFPDHLTNGAVKFTGEAATHEAGHGFGLMHQSLYSGTTLLSVYNPGTNGIAPIMGVSYYPPRGLWAVGATACSTCVQDDLEVLSSVPNGFGYRPDEFGNTIAAASDFPALSGTSLSAQGVINNKDDADYLKFKLSTAGQVAFEATGPALGRMLDIKLELYDGLGHLLATADPADSFDAGLTTTLAGGTYYLAVKGHGLVNLGGQYGRYYDVGSYAIRGTVPATGDFVGVTAGATVSGLVNIGPNLSLHPGIRKVAYYLNGTRSGKVYTTPFLWGGPAGNGTAGFDTKTLADGNYTLGMVYTDSTGDHSVSVSFLVNNATPVPLAIPLPPEGRTLSGLQFPATATSFVGVGHAGSLSFLADATKLFIVNAADPSAPALLSTVDFGTQLCDVLAAPDGSGVYVVERGAFTGGYYQSSLWFVNTSDPGHPALQFMADLRDGPRLALFQDPVKGPTVCAFYASSGENFMVSCPAGGGACSRNFADPYMDTDLVYLHGGWNLSATAGQSHIAIDFQDVTWTPTAAPVAFFSGKENHLFVSLKNGTVAVYDADQADTGSGGTGQIPVVKTIRTQGQDPVFNLIFGDRLAVLDSTGLIEMFDITDPLAPTPVDSVTVPGARRLDFDGSHLYVVTNDQYRILKPPDPTGACTAAMCGVVNGQTVSGVIAVRPNLTLSPDIRKVFYYLNGTQAGKYYTAPFTWGGTGGFDTRTLSNGNYTLGGSYTDSAGDHPFSILFAVNNTA